MPSSNDRGKYLFDSDSALRLLARVMAGGAGVVVIFALSQASNAGRFFEIAGVGLMMAFGATAAGALIGLIFGVPFTRDSVDDSGKKNEESASPVAISPLRYRPNTSLEQISDWLTKMIVGVGLVEIKQVPSNLHSLAHYLATGMGGSSAAETLTFGALPAFAACGFAFGFLWARFNLRRLFSDADKELVDKISRFEADGKAAALATQQLTRRSNEQPVPQEELHQALADASSEVRGLIFSQARAVSESSDSDQYEIKDGVISVLKALVAADKERRYHQTYGELAYALGRKSPPDYKEGLDKISTAIEIRDRLGLGGWKYYEFRRALYRIKTGASAAEIRTDLEEARKEEDKWKRWLSNHRDVAKWVDQNAKDLAAGG